MLIFRITQFVIGKLYPHANDDETWNGRIRSLLSYNFGESLSEDDIGNEDENEEDEDEEDEESFHDNEHDDDDDKDEDDS